jgi:hypothetical protein
MKVLDEFPHKRRHSKRARAPETISLAELKAGCAEFKKRERREPMYTVATFLLKEFWGNPAKVAEGLGVLLSIWNSAFYRNGPFDYEVLGRCVAKNQAGLDAFRNRNILTHSPKDNKQIRALFQDFLDALRICEGKCKGRGSPVGIAKALHLLAPGFFPLWDDKIARAYDCYYSDDPAGQFMAFFAKMKVIAAALAPKVSLEGKTLLKLIDEYNYAKFSKEWV